MGSVIDYVKCPKCGSVLYKEYYYRSGEEYSFCSRCGYNHNCAYTRNDNGDVIPDEDGVTRMHEEETGGFGCVRVSLKDSYVSQLYPLDENEDIEKIKEDLLNDDSVDMESSYMTFMENGILRTIFGSAPGSYEEEMGDGKKEEKSK